MWIAQMLEPPPGQAKKQISQATKDEDAALFGQFISTVKASKG